MLYELWYGWQRQDGVISKLGQSCAVFFNTSSPCVYCLTAVSEGKSGSVAAWGAGVPPLVW